MDPQPSMPQPIQPIPPQVSKQPKGGNKGIMALLLVLSLVLVGGLAYTNLSLTKSNKQVSDLTTKLAEVSSKGGSDELLGFDKVDKEGYQSLTLTGGKEYFGKITSMTTQNVVLEDIYYVRENGNKNDISLVKLGCELHQPEDKMTFVRSNVQLWGNLKEKDAKGVVGAIKTYQKQNPNGQKCD